MLALRRRTSPIVRPRAVTALMQAVGLLAPAAPQRPHFVDEAIDRLRYDKGAIGAACGCNGPRVSAARREPWTPSTAGDLIASPMTVVAAGASTLIQLEPSRGCFRTEGLWLIGLDDADPQTEITFRVGRIMVGTDCHVDCRENAVVSQVFTPSHSRCCFVGMNPPIISGFATTKEALNVEIFNDLIAAGSGRFQVIAVGKCLDGGMCVDRVCDVPKAA